MTLEEIERRVKDAVDYLAKVAQPALETTATKIVLDAIQEKKPFEQLIGGEISERRKYHSVLQSVLFDIIVLMQTLESEGATKELKSLTSHICRNAFLKVGHYLSPDFEERELVNIELAKKTAACLWALIEFVDPGSTESFQSADW